VQAIRETIVGLKLTSCKVTLSLVECQESLNNGIIIVVLGHLSNNGKQTPMQRLVGVMRTRSARTGGQPRRFSQTFFLAAQEPSGYFVLNDIFRYLREDVGVPASAAAVTDDTGAKTHAAKPAAVAAAAAAASGKTSAGNTNAAAPAGGSSSLAAKSDAKSGDAPAPVAPPSASHDTGSASNAHESGDHTADNKDTAPTTTASTATSAAPKVSGSWANVVGANKPKSAVATVKQAPRAAAAAAAAASSATASTASATGAAASGGAESAQTASAGADGAGKARDRERDRERNGTSPKSDWTPYGE
jgi:hypothetical protein